MKKLILAIVLPLSILLCSPSAIAHPGHHESHGEAVDTWTCPVCGKTGLTGNFCSNCGAKKPGTWTCPTCGKTGLTGNFCNNCGTKKPEAAPAKPADNGLSLNVVFTDGKVEQYKLSGLPAFSFGGKQIRIAGKTYSQDKIQRFQYGKSAKGSVGKSDYSKEDKQAIFIYRNDGQFNAFFQKDIRRMTHSSQDTLLVATEDSTFRFPIAVIDSIGLHSFETVYNPRVVKLAPYEPYVSDVSVDNQTIMFSSNLPAYMKPKKGDILFSETFNSTFPEGYAGRVLDTDGYSCTTEPVGLDDVYEKVLMFGEIAPAEQVRRGRTASGPAEDVSIDLANMKLSVTYGPASASLDFDLNPKIQVAIQKASPVSFACISVAISVETGLMAEVSIGGKGVSKRFTGPSLTPMLNVAIPACPIVSVGLDISPFLEFGSKGTLSASASASSKAYVYAAYTLGKFYSQPGITGSVKFLGAKAELEGKISTGLRILPNVQITGGLFRLGPAIEIGPSIAVSLPVDDSGIVNTVYSALVDSKFILSLDAEVSVAAKALKKDLGEMFKFPFNITAYELYFVPLFEKPACLAPTINNVSVSSVASRDLLPNVYVGFDISDGKSWTCPQTYSGPKALDFVTTFSGFNYDVLYTASPFVDIFGAHLEAYPSSNFIIQRGQTVEQKPDVPQIPEPPEVNISANIGGYRFDWEDSEDQFGYFERSNRVYLSYSSRKGTQEGVLHRYNDGEKTYAQKYDVHEGWWVEDDEFGDSENSMIRSREFYNGYKEGRAERKKEAKGLWNVYTDDLGGLAHFEEDFRRHYRQLFGVQNGDKILQSDYVGTGTICGIKCNIYENKKRWPTQEKVWVDPATGLCLRYELGDGYWFQVTKYEVSGYSF